MFIVRKTVDFCSAHVIPGHPKCGRLHGHNFKATVEIRTEQLTPMGFGIDFAVVKEKLEAITKHEFDHWYLNELPAFSQKPPTAEHISEYLFQRLKPEFDALGGELLSVTVMETESCSCTYSERT